MFAFQGGNPLPTINTESSGEFSVDFGLEDVSDAETPAGECSVGPSISQSQAASTKLARRLCRKKDRETLQRIRAGAHFDSVEED